VVSNHQPPRKSLTQKLIYNLSKKAATFNPAQEINISHLPKGIYIGVWQGQADMKTEKVVLE
jgi:hypothetical protein